MATSRGMSDNGLWSSGESGSAVFTRDGNLTVTLAMSCASQNIQGPVLLPFSQTAAIVVRVIQALHSFLILIFGILLNSMVLFIVGRFKKLQTPSFSIGFQVVVLDLQLALIQIFILTSIIAGSWPFGEALCAVVGLIVQLTGLTRTFLMLVLVVDRFLSIFSPFLYPKYNSKIIVCLSLLSWIASILLSISPLPGLLDCYTFTPVGWICTISSSCNGKCIVFVNIYFGLIVAPLTILPLILYIILYCKAKKIKNSSAAVSGNPSEGEAKRRERQITLTFFLLFITLFMVIMPTIGINVVARSLISQSAESTSALVHSLLVFSSSVVPLLVITDPIVIMRNRDVREVLSEIKRALVSLKQ